MTRFLLSAAVIVASCVITKTNAQFTCTLTSQDEDSCLKTVGDDKDHCVWCNLASFGVCVSEEQAEQMEEKFPGIVNCDRFSGDDDAAPPATDDAAPPATDDAAPPAPTDDAAPPAPTDDAAPPAPTDDQLPSDFWTCLQKKDSKSCLSASCTWCKSNEYKFGVCMTGPTADSASNSSFFTCKKPSSGDFEDSIDNSADTVFVEGGSVEDLSCLTANLQNPTQSGCASAIDAQGKPCEWCSLSNMANLCLNSEQADLAIPLGITCQEQQEFSQMATSLLRGVVSTKKVAVEDPMDTACLLAYLQDPTESGCEAALDSEGNPCEFCSLQGQYPLCLNEDQAMFAEQIGMDCGEQDFIIRDPLDAGCFMAYLQDPTEEGCKAAVDSDGSACEFCSLQGQYQLCLNEEQAMFGEQMGMDCSLSNDETQQWLQEDSDEKDPLDTACLLAYLQDPTEDGCHAAVDSDGNACEFCSLQGQYQLCLNQEQAMYGEQFGMECSTEEEVLLLATTE